MIVDVYDLTGALCCSRYEVDENQCSYRFVARERLSDVLICPESTERRNQPPYIQNCNKPFIRDLVDENGNFSYSHCAILGDFLQMEALNSPEKKKLLENYFASLKAYSSDFYYPADKNVILIPDNYNAVLQELILRSCPFPRQNTYLLWRSVAACLGNIEKLQGKKTVAIHDVQQSYYDVSVLNLVQDASLLVPQRKAYCPESVSYPKHNDAVTRATFEPDNEFYRYTYYGLESECIVWDSNAEQFTLKNFSSSSKPWIPTDVRDGVIVVGAKTNDLFSSLDEEGFSLSDGAALYVARKCNGMPTYYDECKGLYIVVQDLENETIFSKELIAPNEKCMGGVEIEGLLNTDCFIEKGTENVRFFLGEEKGDDVPLKILDHHFKIGRMKFREPLKLYPSMIPGQGIATVRVEGCEQLPRPVMLDLLDMAEPTPSETVNSLRAKIEHSYPVDIPHIRASVQMWENIESKVQLYLKDRKDRGIFKNWSYATPNAAGINKLARINVFGTDELPKAEFDFERLFRFMVEDYKQCKKRNEGDAVNAILTMIAHTYQGNNPIFSCVKEDLLSQIIACANGEITGANISTMTACAYLLRTEKELKTYFDCYLKKAEHLCNGVFVSWEKEIMSDLSGLYYWNRALYELMISNGNMLQMISTKDCDRCMNVLLIMLRSHAVYGKYNLAGSVLKAALLLLKRRKYDKTYMKEKSALKKSTKVLRKIMLGRCISRKDEKKAKTVQAWSEIVLKFIEGRGVLDDLISVVGSDLMGNEND